MIDEQTRKTDTIANALRSYAHTILVIVFGLLPLVFLPIPFAPFEYSKVFVASIGIFIALILFSLSVLRSGIITIHAPFALGALWLITAVSLISALLSGDQKDALVGDFFSIHATMFVALLALIPTVWMLLRPTKVAIMKMYIVLAGSTLALVIFHILRLQFGADFLSFDVFTNSVSSPVGTWNDLALFLGLTVILALVALEQLSLTPLGKSLFVGVTLLSLVMLGVINFFMVWLVLGLTSLVMVVYTLGKDRFSGSQLSLIHDQSRTKSLPIALIVFAVSTLFVIGGASLGGWLAERTNINYVEVRPSFQATADIARNVYSENAFLGIGTNKFIDAWRLYKDDSINSTAFWNTDFNAGNGYVTTAFVTTGVLGGITWLLFLFLYVATGLRALFGSEHGDKIWYFIGVSSFVGACYIWGMALIYVPGVVILLLGSLCTGVSLYAFSVISGREGKTIILGANKKTGFALTLGVITIIIASVGTLYTAGRHYSSVYTFGKSIALAQKGENIDTLEREVANAYTLSTSDVFARRIAEFQLQRMNVIAMQPEPSEEDQQKFLIARDNGVSAALRATEIDPTEPSNWAVLGGIYGLLASLGVPEAKDPALQALAKSRELNPKNPLPYLESAIVEARSGSYDAAKASINEAIRLKPNFTEAFSLLSQLEIAQGNIADAINSVRAIIILDPQNAARYYQLGVLEAAQNNTADAIVAFETAIALDTEYANARYLLALAYDQTGRGNDAKAQLQKVLELNPNNADVMSLISEIEQNGSLARLREAGNNVNRMVNETTPVTDDNGTVSTQGDSETPLVTPVNTIPKSDGETIEANAPAGE